MKITMKIMQDLQEMMKLGGAIYELLGIIQDEAQRPIPVGRLIMFKIEPKLFAIICLLEEIKKLSTDIVENVSQQIANFTEILSGKNSDDQKETKKNDQEKPNKTSPPPEDLFKYCPEELRKQYAKPPVDFWPKYSQSLRSLLDYHFS